MSTEPGGRDGDVTCPDCGAVSGRDAVLCRCGYPLVFDRPTARTDEVRSVTRAPGERDQDVAGPPPVVVPRTEPATPVTGQRVVAPRGVPCPACQEPNPPDRTWCARCGARLRAAPVQPPHAPAPPPEPRRPVGRLVLVVVLLVALVAVAGLAAAAWFGRGRPPTAEPSVAVTSTAGPTSAPAAAVQELSPARVVAEASSVQVEAGGSYGPELTLDGLLDTAWNHDGDVPAPGVRITWRFDAPVHVVGMRVVNGYDKTSAAGEDLFAANQRVADARVLGDSAEVAVLLGDVRQWQEVATDLGVTSQVTLEVVSTYPGARYDDVALSEVRFLVVP